MIQEAPTWKGIKEKCQKKIHSCTIQNNKITNENTRVHLKKNIWTRVKNKVHIKNQIQDQTEVVFYVITWLYENGLPKELKN